VKNSLRPISIPHIVASLVLMMITSVALTTLVGPKLAEVSQLYDLLVTFGLNITENINVFIYRILARSQVSFFEIGLAVLFFLLLFIGTAVLTIRMTVRRKRLPDYHHTHGPKLLEFASAWKDASMKLDKEPGNASINIHPKLRFTDQLEQGNILIIGQQGGGKSTVLKPLANQVYQEECISYTYDEKGEYQRTFKDANAICLKLTAGAELVWDIGRDVQDSNDASLVAQAMLEDGKDNERFFIDSARQVLKGVIISLQNTGVHWSWRELHSSLFSNTQQLKRLLQSAYPSASTLIEPDSKTTHSILSVLSSRLFWLADMAELHSSATSLWCISRMMDPVDGKCHVFFRPNYSNPDLSRAVCNAIVTLIIERWLAREDSNERKFWLVLDELGNLPKNPSLIRWLTLSRSKGGRAIASAQSISLLYENYGEHTTETILSLFRTVIVMRLGASGPSAQKASELLGQQRVLTLNQSLDDAEKHGVSTQFYDRPVVTREDIINLPSADKKGVVGFLLIGGLQNIYKLKWPYMKSPKLINPEPLTSPNKPEKPSITKTQEKNRLNKRTKSPVKNCGGTKS
jgi:hypothetical protein